MPEAFGGNRQSGETPQKSHDRPDELPLGQSPSPGRQNVEPRNENTGIERAAEGEPSIPDRGAFNQRAGQTRPEFS